MIRFERESGTAFARVDVTGRLTRADYAELVPRLGAAIAESGSLRLVIVLHDFEGWEAGAAADDLRFDARHRRDFARMAIVGERRWERWGAELTDLVFAGETRFFDRADVAAAEAWARGGA
ncbi:STAS/SEC14 domain-containing protein [Marinivivus vitaminiproducens]|uniref:STAS/SEC14 domain-containing protein n=1 Tax=Marinivivus vitaminiproducens TaxID=3035935 RepID=UPI0027AAB5B0|nr:STAS/SEC14 domain-containing protein [Geminicoccaceae bacterium SCSIO 64248]